MKRLIYALVLGTSFITFGPGAFSQTDFSNLADPESVGMSSERLERLREKIQSYVDNEQMAGLVAGLARHGEPIFLETYGHQNIEDEIPMQADSLFRLYSMSKALTSVLMMTLYEEGLFHLYDPVSKYIPEFEDVRVIKSIEGGTVVTEPVAAPMTLYTLFTHTSGLAYAERFPKEVGFDRSEILKLDQPMSEGVRNLAEYPLLFQPGERFAYGYSHDVMGRIAEVITGKRLDVLMKERIFDPLGFKDTSFSVSQADQGRLANVYGVDSSNTLRNVTDFVPAASDYLNPNNVLFSGGGGLVSSLSDIYRLTQMLLNGGQYNGGRVLSPFTVDYMLKDHLPDTMPTIGSFYVEGVTPFEGSEIFENEPAFDRLFGGLRMSLFFFARVVDVRGRQAMDSEGSLTYGGLAGTYSFGDQATGLNGVLMVQNVGTNADASFLDEFKILAFQAITEM